MVGKITCNLYQGENEELGVGESGTITYTATIKKGTVGKTSNDKATITTTWGTAIPDDGNNISTGGSVTVV
ncbi:MAG: hypothetical protein QM487_00695 [Candidatus Marithrix sp.]